MKNFFSLDFPKSSPGQIIRAHRKNFGITLKELEEVTGIAESNLSAIETGNTVLGPERAHIIGAALGLDPEIILFPEGFKGEFQKKLETVRANAKRVLFKKLRRNKIETPARKKLKAFGS
jgi:transcriptional regulator with XRE-family HTH domain